MYTHGTVGISENRIFDIMYKPLNQCFLAAIFLQRMLYTHIYVTFMYTLCTQSRSTLKENLTPKLKSSKHPSSQQ